MADARIRLKIMADATGPGRHAWEQVKRHGPRGAPAAARAVGQYVSYKQQSVFAMGTQGFAKQFVELHRYAMRTDPGYKKEFQERTARNKARFKELHEQRQARLEAQADPLGGLSEYTPSALKGRAMKPFHRFMNKKRFARGGNRPFGKGASLKGLSNGFMDALKLVSTGGDILQGLAKRFGYSGELDILGVNQDTRNLATKHTLAEIMTGATGLKRGAEISAALTMIGATPTMSQAHEIGIAANRLEVAKNSGILHTQGALTSRSMQNVQAQHKAIQGYTAFGLGFDIAGSLSEQLLKKFGGGK